MSDLDDQIAAALAKPRSATVDGVTVTQHGILEVLEVVKHMQKQTAAAQTGGGIKFSKFTPPSAV